MPFGRVRHLWPFLSGEPDKISSIDGLPAGDLNDPTEVRTGAPNASFIVDYYKDLLGRKREAAVELVVSNNSV
jgi:hypothetical protein